MAYGPEVYDGRDRNFLKAVAGLASEVGTATATAGAATLADYIGVVTSEALTTAQNALYTLTITNSLVAAGDWVSVTIGNGTNTAGTPCLHTTTVTASTITIIISNQHASAVAFNGTIKFYFEVRKALS